MLVQNIPLGGTLGPPTRGGILGSTYELYTETKKISQREDHAAEFFISREGNPGNESRYAFLAMRFRFLSMFCDVSRLLRNYRYGGIIFFSYIFKIICRFAAFTM